MSKNSNLYDQIAKATGVPRKDVKKVVHAYCYSGSGRDIEFQSNKGGSYVRFVDKGAGNLIVDVGESCVVTWNDQPLTVRALAAILTHAKDLGLEKFINEYQRGAGGVAPIPIEKDVDIHDENR